MVSANIVITMLACTGPVSHKIPKLCLSPIFLMHQFAENLKHIC